MLDSQTDENNPSNENDSIFLLPAVNPNHSFLHRFVSKMFHPNVYADGGICLDILQNRWSPTYDVSAILTSIQSLLDEPNPNSPANSVAAQLYQVRTDKLVSHDKV